MRTKLYYYPFKKSQLQKQADQEDLSLPNIALNEEFSDELPQKQTHLANRKYLKDLNTSKLTNQSLNQPSLIKKKEMFECSTFMDAIIIQPEIDQAEEQFVAQKKARKTHFDVLKVKSRAICEIKQVNRQAYLLPKINIMTSIPPHKPKSNQTMKLHQLYEKLQCFDILLFENETIGSKLQRFFTRSKCDHIAIIVKYNRHKYILEAGGKSGVTLTSLQKFINCYERKYLRKEELKNKENNMRSKSRAILKTGLSVRLKRDRQISEESSALLVKFIQKNVGKKYQFHPMYLFSNSFIKQNEGYFCSELIAECLKFCKILPSENFEYPAYSYLPKHFWGKEWAENQQIDDEMQVSKGVDFLKDFYEFTKKVKIDTTF